MEKTEGAEWSGWRERRKGGPLTAVLAGLLHSHFQREHYSKSEIISVPCQDNGRQKD